MRLTIDRIHISEFSFARFKAEYDRPDRETPVILTGVEVPAPEQLSFDDFCARYLPGAKKAKAWFDAPLQPSSRPDMPLPELVRQVLTSPDVAVRPLPMRLWAHPGGHHTLFHYDGNSVSSFNLQLRGHKRWTMVSADTPLPLPPFQLVHTVAGDFQPDPRKYDVCSFDTAPGDMLFLPRYWGHCVSSLGEVNLNVNWVWTPRRPNDTVLGRRERELLALRRTWPRLDRFFMDQLSGYGGDDLILQRYADGIGQARVVTRLARELGALPRMVVRLPGLVRGLRRFAGNNFNLPRTTTEPRS